MSQANVEIVQTLTAAFNRQEDDWHSVLALLDPDVAVDDLDISLDTEPYRGHAGAIEWLGVWGDAWRSWRIGGLETRPLGDDRVIALFEMFVTGKESGIELSRHDAMVYTLRAGKVAKIVYYNDQRQALDAVGLRD
jgi:ketosteroid isomerase-like protein